MVPFQYKLSMTSKFCLFLLFVAQIGTITCQDTDRCVVIGSSWHANCSSSSLNEQFIIWKKDGILKTEYNKETVIQIDSVNQSHAGVYTCLNIQSFFIYSTHKLTPYQPIKFLSPTSYQITLGDNFVIYCHASGLPELTYVWFLNGTFLGSGTDMYSITEADISNLGIYECQITNECDDLKQNIRVSIYRPMSFSEGLIIGFVIGTIILLFLGIICVFVSLVQIRKYIRHHSSGSKSGTDISNQSRLRRKRSFGHSSSHRNSISEMFVQEGIIHENPVFIEGAANEKAATIGNLIGIPQIKPDLDEISHLSLAGSTGGKCYSSDDFDLKLTEKQELNTTDVRRSKSLSYSRVSARDMQQKLAPYEHRFSPSRAHRYQSKPLEFSPKNVSRERTISEVVAKKRKIFDQPEPEPSPPKYSTVRKLGQSELPEFMNLELKPESVPKPRKTVFQRKISLDDELSVTPGDVADFLTNQMAANDSDSDEELLPPLPIRRPHSTETRHFQADTFRLGDSRKTYPELSWDELDKHFHVFDTFVVPGASRQKDVSSTTGTKIVANLESIAEESPSMVQLAEEVSRVAVKKRQIRRQKVSHIDEGDPWKEGDVSYIPKRIVETRSKRFDTKTLYYY